MQSRDFQDTIDRLFMSGQTGITFTFHCKLWEEKIVAALSGDQRMQALLEQEDYFYERVIAVCFYKSTFKFNVDSRLLGTVLVRAANYGLGKRYIASQCGINYLDAQNLLNQYYAVFYKTRDWIKRIGREEVKSLTETISNGLLKDSLERCVKKLPVDWKHKSELVFSIPAYTYSNQVEKFFRHFFEKEIYIQDNVVRLGIEFDIL